MENKSLDMEVQIFPFKTFGIFSVLKLTRYSKELKQNVSAQNKY